MTETWRYVDCGAVDAFENNAQMAVLSRSTADRASPILQTSVWGRTHLNVGWFDDVDSTLDLAACERLGIQVIRRPFAGGGTAYYDAGCAVMFGLMLPKPADPAAAVDLDAVIARLQPIVIDALGRLGLGEVTFQGSADLRWINDRKLGGISAGDFGRVLSVGGFLNIKPPNLDLYLEVVRVPEGKFADKIVKDMREYVCTAEEVAGKPVTYEEFRDALTDAVRAAGIELVDEPMTDVERGALAKISQRIASDDQVRRISSERFASEHTGERVGFANHKGRKLCRAGVALDESDTINAAMMAGDMHVAPPDTLDGVGEALIGADSGDTHDLRGRISAVWDADGVHQADATMGVTTDDLLTAVTKAIAEATEREGTGVKLDGAKILVTGASSGIGAALGPQLAAKGATVGLVARRAERLEAVVEECRVHTPDSNFWVADLGDVDGAVALAETAWDHFGGLDALVNNAAIGKRKLVATLTPEDLDETMRTNFTSPVRMGMALLPRMLECDRGLIVNVSSMGGRLGILHEAAYCASKFALCGWSEGMRLDLEDTGVRVKLVLPGPIETEIWDVRPGELPGIYEGPFVTAADCAADIVTAMEDDDGFEYYTPEEVPGGWRQLDLVVGKTQSCDAFLTGMAQMG